MSFILTSQTWQTEIDMPTDLDSCYTLEKQK